jgi:hypothetical protein
MKKIALLSTLCSILFLIWISTNTTSCKGSKTPTLTRADSVRICNALNEEKVSSKKVTELLGQVDTTNIPRIIDSLLNDFKDSSNSYSTLFNLLSNTREFSKIKLNEPIDASEARENIRNYDQITESTQSRMSLFDIDKALSFLLSVKLAGATGLRVYYGIDRNETGQRAQYNNKLGLLFVATFDIDGKEYDVYSESMNSTFAIRDKGDLCPPPYGSCDGATLLSASRQQSSRK